MDINKYCSFISVEEGPAATPVNLCVLYSLYREMFWGTPYKEGGEHSVFSYFFAMNGFFCILLSSDYFWNYAFLMFLIVSTIANEIDWC